MAFLPGYALPGWAWQDRANLAAIKARMTQNLASVPNYACLETIVRSRALPRSQAVAANGKHLPFRRVDVIRVEVAEVGGDELFARPGEHDFQKRTPSELADTGLMGKGTFMLFAHSIFAGNTASFQFIGTEISGDRTLLQYEYGIAQLESGYKVRGMGGEAIVAYHGTFWADSKTMEATRLDIVADEIPSYVGLTKVTHRIDYAHVRIGDADVQLPQSSEITAGDSLGNESRNQILLSHCRAYTTESAISFDEAQTARVATGSTEVEIPAGLTLSIRLTTAINSSVAQSGDIVDARLDTDVRRKGTVLIPKEAVVRGRVRNVQSSASGTVVELEFSRVEFANHRARFFAQLEKVVLPAGASSAGRVKTADVPGIGGVTGAGDRLLLPAGTRLSWKTLAASSIP